MARLDNKGRKIYDFVCENQELIDEFNKYFDWYTSVPDSVFKSLLPILKPYSFSSRENHCISMAFGAKLGGKNPCVLMQNSGLGLSLDAIFGLFNLYKVGIVIFLSNRGELDWEEVQHQDWGKTTLPMLDSMNFKRIDFEQYGLKSVEMANQIATQNNEVVFVIIHRGNLHE